ncbi:2-amino-4-hydroxy-6-hydroxymethyldihydropteridinediphosphokinase [Nitrosomonas cryotolerans]|uniref:2-amino-4-hydroxy-6-hydroxymethyldihydropteridine pyrophosphokinase n=1 Tax=Nitrosomonas cryotolerans ATCC 49181 TaxID=1131553 RepID=A0A1N6HAB9_9PROT|nr:2-amino-4-hydroxy-6-hydroxymethyldihydropteridine diphosphokinase [Nitrosomonas cryotolerans]SFQ15108.1 2-amino-4-hydroxy-6-hydroxymethyldihydropteridinediphosphokinase [Nitrosomonas cryotolerans]SIO16617.1 2-amino-4-hydroxy-6-hydroxymethyldihydropteridinediphosphokinase [Nitrosomonas cryotolerans ATCC 49181]
MNDCILSIGSNINPEENIRKTLIFLKQKVNVIDTSSWVKTTPIGITDQADFINGAVRIRTAISQQALTQYLKNLEDRLGRDRSLPKFGPRVIDLDIVVWNNKIIDNDYYTRDFIKNSVHEVWQK